MSLRFLNLAIALLLPSCFVAAADSSEELALLRAEVSELREIVSALRETNQRLQNNLDGQAEDLILASREAEGLAAALRACRSESGTNPPVTGAAPPPTTLQKETPTAGKTGVLVDYVNAAHHYLVLRAGTVDGLDVGQKGRVIRDGEVLATIHVIHVLPKQAVVDLIPDSLTSPGVYPRQGDFVLIP